MATIRFKAKIQTVYTTDSVPLYQYLTVPQLDRKHCDMPAFRQHAKYGGLANSDLFHSVLAGIRRTTFKNGLIRLDQIPDGVTVDTSGFLAAVSFDV